MGNFLLAVCSFRVFLRSVVLLWGDENLEEPVEGLERPVRGMTWLICIPEILVLSGRNQIIISFRLRISLGKTRFVRTQMILFKLTLESVS